MPSSSSKLPFTKVLQSTPAEHNSWKTARIGRRNSGLALDIRAGDWSGMCVCWLIGCQSIVQSGAPLRREPSARVLCEYLRKGLPCVSMLLKGGTSMLDKVAGFGAL